jgi:hypothetical protein
VAEDPRPDKLLDRVQLAIENTRRVITETTVLDATIRRSNQPFRACPTCQGTSFHWLKEASMGAVAAYYRCDHCGHVWSQRSDIPNAEPRTVRQGVIPALPAAAPSSPRPRRRRSR